MTSHAAQMVRPDGYTVAYQCSCTWMSDQVPSDEGWRAGAQTLRHLAEHSREDPPS